VAEGTQQWDTEIKKTSDSLSMIELMFFDSAAGLQALVQP
jgi:hypothetical protein